MKFSYNWLAELVVGLDADPRQVAAEITMKTAEGEGVELVGEHLTAVSLAKVESVEPIGEGPNTKAQVITQRYGRKTVVCGAPNVRAGLLTAYVPPGTRLNGPAIAIRTIQGVESEGMLVSGAELGINRDSGGILEMGKGINLGLLACLPDHIIEIDNKSLNHRPDLWGHLGMAREVAAWSRHALRDPVELDRLPHSPSPLRIAIEEPTLCARWSGLVLENVTVQPSPLWMQYRLRSIGINPINNIVDVTNYVMAELAQPMHAFDRAKVSDDTIVVRLPRRGETIAALNEEEYELPDGVLLIADPEKAIAIAGIVGGAESAISGSTNSIILESANFDAASIRKSSTKLKLRTDASMRFEKAQDPENTVRGLARALQLLEQVSPGIQVIGGLADAYHAKPHPEPILLPLDWLSRKLGIRLEEDEVRQILRRLHFVVEEAEPGLLRVQVPSWRATKDISIKEDLVEEIGRMIGYDSIPITAPLLPVTVPPINRERKYFRHVRSVLTQAGYTGVSNYSFMSDEQAEALSLPMNQLLAVDNPIAAGQNYMRPTLLAGIRKNVLDNSRHFDQFRLFEIGYEIHKRDEGLPEEIPHLVAAFFDKEDAEPGLFELKGVVESLCPGVRIEPGEPRSFEHPVRAAKVVWQGSPVGRLFEFHPSLVPGRTAVLELNLASLLRLDPGAPRYRPVRRFPSSAFDLSVVVPERELAGNISDRLQAAAGERLVKLEFLRQYQGAPIPESHKSLSYRLTLAAPDRTLSLEEVGEIRALLMAELEREGYDLRV